MDELTRQVWNEYLEWYRILGIKDLKWVIWYNISNNIELESNNTVYATILEDQLKCNILVICEWGFCIKCDVYK
jgi:hypothetical protein